MKCDPVRSSASKSFDLAFDPSTTAGIYCAIAPVCVAEQRGQRMLSTSIVDNLSVFHIHTRSKLQPNPFAIQTNGQYVENSYTLHFPKRNASATEDNTGIAKINYCARCTPLIYNSRLLLRRTEILIKVVSNVLPQTMTSYTKPLSKSVYLVCHSPIGISSKKGVIHVLNSSPCTLAA